MEDKDLIERIEKADPEKLKQGLVEELNGQRKVAGVYEATWYNCYRSCLDSALKRTEYYKEINSLKEAVLGQNNTPLV